MPQKEIGWCEGEWWNVDPELGKDLDRNVQKRHPKFAISTISGRRRRFNIALFRPPPDEKARLAKNEYERKKRYEKLHPGREINELMARWHVLNLEELNEFKRKMNCE